MKRGQWLTGLSLLCAAIFTVGGCGGSGGGDGGGGGGGASDQVSITANNAMTVTENAMGAVAAMVDVADFGEFLVEVVNNLDVTARIAARSAAVQVPGVCAEGTVDVTVDDVAPLDALTLGDSAVITFASCKVADDEFGQDTINGSISLSVTGISAESVGFPEAPFEVTYALTFTNLSVIDDALTTTVSGGFDLTIASQDGTAFTSELSGTSFSLSEQGFSVTLSDFNFFGTVNEDTGDYTADASGTLTSSDFDGGFVDFDTTTTFAGTEPDNPDEGGLGVTGASGSMLAVTVLDNVTLEVSLDADGDGTPDEGYPVEVLWDDLDL